MKVTENEHKNGCHMVPGQLVVDLSIMPEMDNIHVPQEVIFNFLIHSHYIFKHAHS